MQQLIVVNSSYGGSEPGNDSSCDSSNQNAPRINRFCELPNRGEEYIVTIAMLCAFGYYTYFLSRYFFQIPKDKKNYDSGGSYNEDC